MDKEALGEIRKLLRRDEPPIDWVYCFYVSPENEITWQSFRKFLSFDMDEAFRYKDLFKKALAGTPGRELFSVSLASQSDKLSELRLLENADEETLSSFAEAVAGAYTHTDPYFAFAARIVYDVPAKGSDHRRLEDGDTVYQSILFAICPAQLSKPALGYDDFSGVTELTRRWTIGQPLEGFLYPAFTDRIGDLNEVLYRAKKEISGELYSAFFDAELPVTADMQKEAFRTLLDALDVSLESASQVQEDLEHLDGENVTILEKNEAKKLAERCGIDTSDFDETYDDTIGDVPLSIPAIRESAVIVTTDSATIKVANEKAQLITTRVIDGISYILIPADGSVLVNGVPASPARAEVNAEGIHDPAEE